MTEVAPNVSAKERAFAAEYVFTTMGAIAEAVTDRGKTRAEVETWANVTGDLLASFLSALATNGGRARGDVMK